MLLIIHIGKSENNDFIHQKSTTMSNTQPTSTYIIMSIAITAFSGIILIKSINTGENWRMIAAGIGFLIFAVFTILLIRKSKKDRNIVE